MMMEGYVTLGAAKAPFIDYLYLDGPWQGAERAPRRRENSRSAYAEGLANIEGAGRRGATALLVTIRKDRGERVLGPRLGLAVSPSVHRRLVNAAG